MSEGEARYPTGVIHGRFQILHNDHLKYLLAGKALCRHLVVAVTNPDPHLTQKESADPTRHDPLENPLTYYERHLMVREALLAAGVHWQDFTIVPLPISQPERYRYYVPLDAAFFLSIYDDWGRRKRQYFESLGLRVHVLWEVPPEKKGISAGEIRRKIIAGRPWEHLVPPCVPPLIAAWGVPERLKRIRKEQEPAKIYAADGSHLEVAAAYWQEAAARDPLTVCNLTFFESIGPGRYRFRFLNEEIGIDLEQRSLLRRDTADQWTAARDPLLTLATVLYLKNVQAIHPLGQDIVSGKDLKEGHFFTGPHVFRTDPILKRFGQDLAGFQKAGQALGGKAMPFADAAFQVLPFPRLPLYFLLWRGDEEFKPRLQVLFDRPIEAILPADAIWALVNRVAAAFGQMTPNQTGGKN